MYRALNTVHRIRPRTGTRFKPVIRIGGVRIGPKKSKPFSAAFVHHHVDEFITKMRTGEITLLVKRTVVGPDDLLIAALSGKTEKAAPIRETIPAKKDDRPVEELKSKVKAESEPEPKSESKPTTKKKSSSKSKKSSSKKSTKEE